MKSSNFISEYSKILHSVLNIIHGELYSTEIYQCVNQHSFSKNILQRIKVKDRAFENLVYVCVLEHQLGNGQ